MTIQANMLPDAPHLPSAVARANTSPVSMAGVQDSATLARQQLTSAVPAPAQSAAYAATNPTPPRALLRNSASGLAAQLLSQGAAADENFQALFIPATTPTTAAPKPDTDFLQAMRLARGETAPTAAATSTVATATPARREVQATQTPSTESPLLRPGMPAMIADAGPITFVAGGMLLRKKMPVVGRAMQAYTQALARNAAWGMPPATSAITASVN
jgi:hypothetical protein